MTRLLYNLLFPIFFLLALPGYLLRMLRRGGFREGFSERFGIYPPATRARLAGSAPVWVHAVSVGEVMIALKLIETLLERNPQLKVVLSTNTSTGQAIARKAAVPNLINIYHPLDFPPFVRRAINAVRPAMLVLVEAEIWPNLTHYAKQRGARIALVNARLSPRSEARFRRFRFLTASLFRQLDLACVQADADVERFTAVGVRPEALSVTGSIKFDESYANGPIADDLAETLIRLAGRNFSHVLMAGSTHAGEEKLIGEAFMELRKEFPQLLLFVAPRHVERKRSVLEDLASLGLKVQLRSDSPQGIADAILLDTTGELRSWYQIATVTFVGKSLLARGGQNPAEPIAAGSPAVFGPEMQNFASLVRELLAANGATQVISPGDLPHVLGVLLRSDEKRSAQVQNGRNVLERHRGATLRTCQLLERPGFRLEKPVNETL